MRGFLFSGEKKDVFPPTQQFVNTNHIYIDFFTSWIGTEPLKWQGDKKGKLSDQSKVGCGNLYHNPQIPNL